MKLLYAISMLALSTPIFAFDCEKASTAREKAICSDNGLSLMSYDDSLNQIYNLCLKIGTLSNSELISEQRAWLKENEACGNDSVCIMQGYDQRLSQLAVCSFPNDESSHEKEAFELNFYQAIKNDMLPPIVETTQISNNFYIVTVATWRGSGGTSYDIFQFKRGKGAEKLSLEFPILPSSDLVLRKNPNITSDVIGGFSSSFSIWNPEIDGSVWENVKWVLHENKKPELIYLAIEINAAEEGGKEGRHVLIDR